VEEEIAQKQPKKYVYFLADTKNVEKFKLQGYGDFNATKDQRKELIPVECLASHRLLRRVNMKKILSIIVVLSVFILSAAFSFAQVPGLRNFGKENAPFPSVTVLRGGGTNAASDVTGSHVQNLFAPGCLCYESLAGDGTTQIVNCTWFDANGTFRFSSGTVTRSGSSISTDGSTDGYGLPWEVGFDYESSGVAIGSQS